MAASVCEEGGFLAFQTMYPSLCENKTSSYRCAGLTSLSQPCLPVSNVGPTRILPFLYLGSQQDALSKDITQLYEFEKHLKRERELNNNGAGESPGDRASDPWVMPSPTFTPNPLNVTSKRGFSLSKSAEDYTPPVSTEPRETGRQETHKELINPPPFPGVNSVASASTVTTTQTVKLKSFSLSASLPLSLMAQSPTTSLARLHFESAENSDNESDSNKMDIEQEDCTQSSEHGHKRMSRKSLNDSLERLSSFPSTSLDKLNFTPCLSSSNENLLSSSPSPRTSGVKRPLNMDIADIKDSEASCSSAGGSTASSPTSSSGLKTSVRKRDGRGKRPSVRPNSIAFSSYPTFDIGSEGQDSPHSSCSSASQDDTSDMYAQNGKKLKPSEYMTDVRFRLGRYSEREVYRQITAAMEAAMMKSQSFEATRKSRSLDDILSSEDDSSAPNCEWSHFDRVLRRCRDRFASPPHCFEKLACSGELQDLYNSNSSLSSAGSHSSLHSSIEFIQVS
ncbi:DUS16-like protein [Mya arenaria]|uniref:DUS16-like protein n=1 Tax=Mya arenaria TaxID=6604 RepID=A0ABY7EKU7_MYAAR|nr:DUS16-like protein [Mya arenaria]